MCRLRQVQRSSGDALNPEYALNEADLHDAIHRQDLKNLKSFKEQDSKVLSLAEGGTNWHFVKRCAKAAVATGNVDLMKIVIDIFFEKCAEASGIGKIFVLEMISVERTEMVTALLQHLVDMRTLSVSVAPRSMLFLFHQSNVLSKSTLFFCITFSCIQSDQH